jgi:hypothetical protein
MVRISIYNPLKHISQLEQCQIVNPNCGIPNNIGTKHPMEFSKRKKKNLVHSSKGPPQVLWCSFSYVHRNLQMEKLIVNKLMWGKTPPYSVHCKSIGLLANRLYIRNTEEQIYRKRYNASSKSNQSPGQNQWHCSLHIHIQSSYLLLVKMKEHRLLK